MFPRTRVSANHSCQSISLVLTSDPLPPRKHSRCHRLWSHPQTLCYFPNKAKQQQQQQQQQQQNRHSSPTDLFNIIHTYVSCTNLLLIWHSAHPLRITNVTKVTVEMNALLPYYLQIRCYRYVAKYCSFSSRSVIIRSVGCGRLCYSHMDTRTVTP